MGGPDLPNFPSACILLHLLQIYVYDDQSRLTSPMPIADGSYLGMLKSGCRSAFYPPALSNYQVGRYLLPSDSHKTTYAKTTNDCIRLLFSFLILSTRRLD